MSRLQVSHGGGVFWQKNWNFDSFKEGVFPLLKRKHGVSLPKIAILSRLSKSPLELKPRPKAYETRIIYRTASQTLVVLHIHLNKREDLFRSYK